MQIGEHPPGAKFDSAFINWKKSSLALQRFNEDGSLKEEWQYGLTLCTQPVIVRLAKPPGPHSEFIETETPDGKGGRFGLEWEEDGKTWKLGTFYV